MASLPLAHRAQVKQLLYVGTEIPQQGFGAWVIVYRHLARLEGSISILDTASRLRETDEIQRRWRYLERPRERVWNWDIWNRSPHGYRLRAQWFTQHYARQFAVRPNAILNIFGVNSVQAEMLARHWRVPLLLFLHDRWQVWTKPLGERILMRRGYAAKILARASRIWSVSPELAAAYNLQDECVRVLFPLPEGASFSFAEWRAPFQNPTLVFAGFVHDHHIAHFARLARILQTSNGRLLVLTDRAEKIRAALGDLPNVEYHTPLTRNADALAFVRSHATAFVIPWAFGQELEERYWDRTNFPSKLVEFSHTGLPLLLLAPRDTALSNWALAHDWLGYCDEPNEARLQALVANLTQATTWERMAAQTRHAASDEFHPWRIHAQFERDLVLA